MTAPEIAEPEVVLSVAEVARLMNVSKEDVRNAVRSKRLRVEVIFVGDRIGLSVPLSAVAEFWNLSQATINEIQTDARTGIRKAPVAIVTTLFSRRVEASGVSARPVDPGVAADLSPQFRSPSLPRPSDSRSRR